MEECAEVQIECANVQKVAGKILRFGLHNVYPPGPHGISNRSALLSELDDLEVAIKRLRTTLVETSPRLAWVCNACGEAREATDEQNAWESCRAACFISKGCAGTVTLCVNSVVLNQPTEEAPPASKTSLSG